MVDVKERIDLILQTKDKTLLENLLYEYGGENFSMYEIGNVLMEICDDKEYIKSFIANSNYGLNSFQKEAIISMLGDDTFRDACIRGEVEGVDLEPFSKARLYMTDGGYEYTDQKDLYIRNALSGQYFELDSLASEYLIDALSDVEEKKQYILDDSIPLEISERVALANGINEDDFIREVVAPLRVDENYKQSIPIVRAVSTVKSADIRKDFIRNNHGELSYVNLSDLAQGAAIQGMEEISDICEWGVENGIELRKLDDMVNAEYYKNEGNRANWNAGVKRIATVSELDQPTLEQNPDIKYVRMQDAQNPNSRKDMYTRERYGQIRGAIDKVVEGIPVAEDGNPKSQVEAFSKVYSRLSNIKYDNYAISKKGEMDPELQMRCRNLEGGLLDGKCICAGYSEILKNALSCVNIESITVGGNQKGEGKAGHAWNQVRIGDNWLNCDLTNDRDCGKFFNGKFAHKALKSDKQFKGYDRYSENRPAEEHRCDVPLTEIPGATNPSFSSYVKSWASNIKMNQIQEASREVAAIEQAPMITAQEQNMQIAAQQATQQVATPPPPPPMSMEM
ncbi:MAG: hypothetical protein IJX99_04215 [Clostridia bacterium]|nr:hypothetical protein [Clostridia bacterium]